MRKLFVKIFVSFLAVASMSGFLSGLVIATTSTSAGAAPSQTAGDDNGAWQNNWSWTYASVYTLDESGTGFFSINENDTYTVQGIVQHQTFTCPASYDGGVCNSTTAGAIPGPTYTAYQVAISGSVTGGSGAADGESVTVKSGSVTGTEWFEVSNLALIEEDQTQNVSGSVSVDSLTLSLAEDAVYTPPQVGENFRLHSGDSWLESTVDYNSGLVQYNATGLVAESGTDPIDSYSPISATATDTSVSGGDSINYDDTADQVSDTRVWSPSVHNLTSDNFLTGLPQGTACTSSAAADCINETETLSSSSTPAPALGVSESINGTTSGLACGGQALTVTGALSSGASGVPVTVSVDESTIVPNQKVTTTVNSTGGGAYTANITAPNTPDGLNKPGVNGTFGVEVSGGSAQTVEALEVSPQDCTTTTYDGATSGPVGGSAAVSATVVDIATNHPVAGATVTFSLAGQSTTATGVTNGSGVATANLLLQDNPSATPYILTASYAGGPADAASSGVSNFLVIQDPTSTTVTPSETSATIGDTPTFTAQVSATGATSTPITGTVTFSVNGSQLGSPVAVSGTGSATSAPLNTTGLGLGSFTVLATYSGNTNYSGSSGTIPAFVVHKPLTPTVTQLAINPASGTSVFGQAVTLTATVTPQVDNTNGAITFFDGSTSLGTANLSGTSPDTAQITVSTLTVGSHSLTAAYGGDNNVTFAPSTSNPTALTVAVAPTTTSVTLGSPATTPVAFQPVTFNIAVAPPAGETVLPTGTVQVTVNGVALGGALTLSGGTTTVSDTAGLKAGPNTISATYSGSTGFAASSGSLAQPVNQASTTTALVSSTGATGSVLNQPVTFTANVTPQEAGNPSGTVTFDACAAPGPCSTSIGQLTLTATGSAGSQATLQISSLPEGDNYISVTYGGDTNFTGSSSTQFDQVVSPPPPTAVTTTSVAGTTSPVNSSANTSIFGQAITFTATVSAPGTALGPPIGTVQFSVDGNNLGGPVTLDSGSGDSADGFSATATSSAISSLVAGGHSVIATYSGLTGAGIPQAYEGSGAIVTEEVQQAATTISGAPSANPAAYGQSESFTATLKAVAPGAGTPGGTVQFSLNGTALGAPATVSGGSASANAPANLQPGTYTVTLVSSGDANFLSSSGSFTFVVQPIPTTTALTATPNPVVFGQPLALVATVSHATGPGVPTGTVTFKDGATVLSVQTVAPSTGGSAQASFTTSTLAAGVHSLTASYSGSPTFGVSTSSALSVTVGSSPTKVVAQAAIVRLSLASLLAPATVVSLGPLQATLTTSGGTPIVGQTLSFSAEASPGGPVVCTGVTNAQGLATCTPTIAGSLEVDLTGGFTATFVAAGGYGGSNGSAGLISILL